MHSNGTKRHTELAAWQASTAVNCAGAPLTMCASGGVAAVVAQAATSKNTSLLHAVLLSPCASSEGVDVLFGGEQTLNTGRME